MAGSASPSSSEDIGSNSGRGLVALVGSGEFLPQSIPLDRRLLAGRPNTVAVLPTAAGLEGDRSVSRWSVLGVGYYTELGMDAVAIPALDRASADDAGLAALVDGVGLIYFSGGDPVHVTESLRGTLLWSAVLAAWNGGTSLAGCSAGAMMMGSTVASPRRTGTVAGLATFDGLCVLPHFDRFAARRPDMTSDLAASLPTGTTLIGVDEDTALVVDPTAQTTEVIGRQQVWHLNPSDGHARSWSDGEATTLELSLGP